MTSGFKPRRMTIAGSTCVVVCSATRLSRKWRSNGHSRANEVSPWPPLGLGHVALAEGAVDAALAWFRRGLKHAPNHRELNLGTAQALIQQFAFDQALAILSRDDLFRCGR